MVVVTGDEPDLAAEGWNLSTEQDAQLDKASEVPALYPYWHQRQFTERNPLPIPESRQE